MKATCKIIASTTHEGLDTASISSMVKMLTLAIVGQRKGRSLLIEDGALAWMIANCSTTLSSTRRHIEIALCHLAQNGNLISKFSFYSLKILYT